MSKHIRVLIVEDSEDDARLLVQQLRRGGFDPEFERLDTAEEMAAALAKQPWDLVISDYVMPHFSGIAALELSKKSALDIPFIIISGNIGEDVAVAAMKAGAHDYMMKGNVQRLIPSIERELREAEVRRQRRRAEEEVKRNLDRIKALHEIDLAITSTLNLRAVLDVLLEKIDLVLPYSATTVRLFNKETRELEPVACRNINEREWKAISRKGLDGLAKIVLDNQVSLTVANVQTDSRSAASEFARKEGLLSYVGVPLIAKREILGLICFYTKKDHSFSDNEIEFLTTLAGQAAVAIHNSQLFEQTKIAGEKLEVTNQRLAKSLKELSRLYTALAPLSPAESVNGMLDGIVERLMEATGADSALIRLDDRQTRSFHWAAQRGFPDYYLRAIEAAPPGGAADWVFKSGEPIIATDIAADSRLKGKMQLQMGLRSCAMLPLKVQNEIRGIVHIASRELGYFEEGHKDNLTAIARLMSIALENKDLFDELRASRDSLEKSNKVKDEFLSVMSHELRTPLNVMMGYTGLLREGMFGELNLEQEGALKKITSQSNDLLSIVNQILRTTQIESGAIKAKMDNANLGVFLDELKMAFDIPMSNDLTIDWDYPSDLPIVATDSEKLKQVLQSLIDNAIKFTNKGQIVISARYLAQARIVKFKVADTGIGIAKEALPYIFDMFRQADSSDSRPHGGVGLGLYIVKKYTEMIGGKISVRSEVGEGSIFTVIIPAEIQSSSPDLTAPS
ncbi:MAG: GAF domain-containing protein [Deltaproteobacteria bacterium]|nr:GAF domain-containing protein [Deltaproteobacteria bacterium]